MDKIYGCDVAISFLQQDESEAQKILDTMTDLKSFIYTRKQEEIVGNDALIKFKRVFGYDSRIVVILYRANWGKTPFTYAEEEVIRDRKFREMSEGFMIIVNMTGKETMPEWVSDRTIWYNLNEFGLKGISAVVRKKIEERGGLSRPETIVEIANRKIGEYEFRNKRDQFINSEKGVKAAESEFRNLVDIIQNKAVEVNNSLVNFKEDSSKSNMNRFVMRGNLITLSVNWTLYLSNTLESGYVNKYAHLDVQILKRNMKVRDSRGKNNSRNIYTDSFNFDMFYPNMYGWHQIRNMDFISSNNLADIIMTIMLENV